MNLRRILSVLLAAIMVISMVTVGFTAVAAEETEEGTYSDVVSSGDEVEVNPYSDAAMALDKEFAYDGNDLGCTYTPEKTTFKVWAPTAENVALKLYATGSDEEEGAADLGSYAMAFDESNGCWSVTVEGDLKNVYYTYEVSSVALVTEKTETNEVVDPYAKAVGVNGDRAMVVDLDSTDPENWADDAHIFVDQQSDAIIWEVVVRDFSASETSGVSEANRGKFLAFTEEGTTVNGEGSIATCVDYLKTLGITHVQINPFYDFATVNETEPVDNQYNWGYDPKNYNVPEGSYSSNPYDGNVRINECKQMIQALHEAGIGVIMDVVYNHTYFTDTSNFQQIVPNYYYRFNKDGGWSNGSGCANDTASERAMFRKFMIESCRYWVEEYHVDGFRFDLMGLHDVETMNLIREDLDKIDSRLVIYGEGWSMTTAFDKTTCAGTETLGANQLNANELSDRVGMFNDQIRDAIKGNVFTNTDKGFAQGVKTCASGVLYGIRANTVGKGSSWEPVNPNQCITYTSCHDNHTLYDRLVASTRGEDAQFRVRYSDLVEMNKLAAATVLTSQGTAFFLAGEEFARSKDGEHNSYNSPIELNEMDWSLVVSNADIVSYYKGLINIRKNFAPFTDNTGNYALSYKFNNSLADVTNVISYVVDNDVEGEWDKVAVILNSGNTEAEVKFANDEVTEWVVIADNTCAGVSELYTVESNTVKVAPSSALVAVDKASFDAVGLESNESKVVVKHVNAANDKVITTQVITGTIGTGYETAVDSSLALRYDVDRIEGDAKGEFGEEDKVVTYYYNRYVAPSLYNDVSLDGKVTIADATAIQKHLARMIEFTDEQETLGDYDYSGGVTIKDATTLQKHLASIDVSIATVVTNFYYQKADGTKTVVALPVEKEYRVGTEYKTAPTTVELYTVKEELPDNAEGIVVAGVTVVDYYYDYSASGIKIHAIHLDETVTWTPFLWSWSASGQNAFASWPGVPMMEDEDGWYSIDAALPEGESYSVIISNNGSTQSADYDGYTSPQCWIVIDDYNIVNKGNFLTVYDEKPDIEALREAVNNPAPTENATEVVE